jgi:PTS system nitrogen regulatory IIA component
MVLEQIIKPDSVLCNVSARSKKHCLEILSELIARNNPDIAREEIFSKLIDRERLGCTSLQQGVAFPRCRIGGIDRSSGALMKLSEPIDFDSPDGLPVDLIVGFIVPKNVDASHHAEVDSLSILLADQSLRARLRAATSSVELFDALSAAQRPVATKIQQSQNE